MTEESAILFHMLGDYPFLRQNLILPQVVPQRPDYVARVRIIQQTPTHIESEIDGRQIMLETRDVVLVQSQTEAPLEACVYALYRFDNDIVNAVMDLVVPE